MALIILNVPALKWDSTEMPAEEWLALAKSDDDSPSREYLTRVHGNMGADGFHMHIAVDAPLCSCGNAEKHAGFDNVAKGARFATYRFSVQRRYLVEALAGMNPGTSFGCINVYSVDPDGIIVLQDVERRRTALIMPMHRSAVEHELVIPDLTELASDGETEG